MSHSSLKKKLRPAKKAWKNLVKKVESKLHSLTFSKAFNAIKTNSGRLLSYCSLHFFRKLSIKSPPYRHRHGTHLYQYYYTNNKNKNHYHYQSNSSPIYIDQLYSLESGGSSMQGKHCPTCKEASSSGSIGSNKEKVLNREDDNKGKEKILSSIEEAWRKVVAKSPQLRPVDDRAEEFICKFRQEIRLQKEKSLVEFEEMLARGT